MELIEQLVNKWQVLVDACKAYYIDSVPTGISDSEFDDLERRAAEDGFFARDYVLQKYSKGAKSKNYYIEKIKKTKVVGKTMYQAIFDFWTEVGEQVYCDLKYDGSSIAIYLDPTTGIPKKCVTVGNLNLDNFGVDQTWKLRKFLPLKFPKGITAIQVEALIDITRLPGDPEKARQKANGLINSKYCDDEVANLLTLRAYRYYTDDSDDGKFISGLDYRDVLSMFDTVVSPIDGHILFAPAQSWSPQELVPSFCETDKTTTNTGTFLNDGWVIYNTHGVCLGALKYSGAGSDTELIKTHVKNIIWNDQTPKGKDSWSANVEIEPVTIKGTVIRKPSAGSVSKLVKNNITFGAEVSIILANSTIPMVGDVFSQGNGDYQWPTCDCGYKLGEKDVFGSLLKCGNPMCSNRIGRMKTYIGTLSDIHKDLDLNQLLVIDRFKWQDTDISIDTLLEFIENYDESGYHQYLLGYMKTDLQRRNMELVWKASYSVLLEIFEKCL